MKNAFGKRVAAGLFLGMILTFLCHGMEAEAAVDFQSMEIDHSMELQYADQFSVDYYEGEYALITISDGSRFLVVPEGQEIPENVEKDIEVLSQPMENLYVAATASMDYFAALDRMDAVTLSGTDTDNWYVDAAREAMEQGEMVYAGKYNAPDYELILSKGCELAVESTMIYHNPEVKEMLNGFGISVLVDYSSYENHPLGRVEWVKLYAVLLGKEDEAEKLFAEWAKEVEAIQSDESTGKTVAFFYITASGYANVRKSNDYVAKMIELAGGEYIFHDLDVENDNALSTMNMQMEEFYAKAKDADYIIYNSTIDGELHSLDELLEKSGLLEDFKAVQEGNVWCLSKSMFQETTSLGKVIVDIHTILTKEHPDETLNFLYKLK